MKNLVKTVTLTRANVINAIETEPLLSGSFVETKKNTQKVCSVCAVGGVLHKAGFNAKAIDRISDKISPIADNELDIESKLSNNDFLSALSMKFELMANQLGKVLGVNQEKLTKEQVKVLREPLIKWVKANFPKNIGKVKVTKEFDSFEGKKVTSYYIVKPQAKNVSSF